MSNSRERIAIRESGLSNSRERIAIRENELSNSRERITNPWERIAQFDITIYLWLFWKSPCPFRAFVEYNWWNDWGYRILKNKWKHKEYNFSCEPCSKYVGKPFSRHSLGTKSYSTPEWFSNLYMDISNNEIDNVIGMVE